MTARRRVLRPTREEAVAALLAATLFAVAFPPFRFVVPVLLCLAPLAVAIARQADEGGRWTAAARTGFWFGFLGYAVNLYWIAVALSLFTKLAILGYIASLAWLAPWVAVWAASLYAARRLTRWPMALLLPLTWGAHELVLTYLADLAFPWLPLGLGVAEAPLLAQLADLSGVHGLSFWIAATNGFLADAWLLRLERRRAVSRVAGAVALAALVMGYGAWRLRTTVTRPVAPIAVVQPNIPEDDKLERDPALRDAFQRHVAGILAAGNRQATSAGARLVVWPETALPGFLQDHPDWVDSLHALAAGSRTPILFGVLDLEWQDTNASPPRYAYYNAAMLTDSTGRLGAQAPYRKRYLVPIVERVPFLNPEWFSGLKYFGGFGRGLAPVPFQLPFGKLGVLICYESIFPQQSRGFRRAGADILANITNDAWFGRSSAPFQHFAHLRLRAIENRVGIVRSANTGISAYVDPLGRVHDATELYVPATRLFTAETTDVMTPYVRLGDWVGLLSFLATLALVLLDARRSRRLRLAGTPAVTRDPLEEE